MTTEQSLRDPEVRRLALVVAASSTDLDRVLANMERHPWFADSVGRTVDRLIRGLGADTLRRAVRTPA